MFKNIEDEMLACYGFTKGQIVLYKDGNWLRPVTISGMGTYLDEYDVLYVKEFEGYIMPSDVWTKKQILELFEPKKHKGE